MIPNNSDYNPSNSEKLNNTFSSQDYDVDKLLNFAEDLKKNCDIYLDRFESLLLKQTITILLMIFLVIILILLMYYYSLDFLLVSVSIPFLSMYFFVLNSQIKKTKRRFYSEQKALEETVELLREISGLMRQENQWTKLQDIEFQIRLSRFNIGKYLVPQSLFEGLTKKKII